MLDGETRVLTQELLERFSLMGGGIIQENDDGTTQVSQQRTQEHTDLLLCDVVKEQQIVEAQMVPLGAQRNSGNDRDLIPSPLAMTMDGSLPLRGPGSGYRGN